MARRGISGAAENPDLESRLIKIENKIKNLGSSFQSTPVDSTSPPESGTKLTPGIVSGVRVTNRVPGSVTFRWEPLTTTEVNHYEIWVSTDTSYVDTVDTKKYKVSNKTNVFVFAETNDDITDPPYYFKIRAISGSGRAGPWSVIVNSVTGKATASHFGFGTDVLEDSQTWVKPDPILEISTISTGTHTHDFPVAIQTVGSVAVEITEPSALLCMGLLNLQFSVAQGTQVSAGFTVHSSYAPPTEKDVEFGTSTTSVNWLMPADGVVPLYFADVFDPPGIGTYTFQIKLKLEYAQNREHGFGYLPVYGFYYLDILRRIGLLGFKLTIMKLV